MTRRWRPSLGFVLGGALSGTLVLSFIGLIILRYLGPEIGFKNAAALLGTLIALATAGLGWLLVRLLLRPIHALEHYAEETETASGTATPPKHFGTRELHATAQRVIAMADALRNREATIRTYTDHATHELKTPVSAIRAAVELLEDGGGLTPEDQKLVQQIDGARLQIEAQLAALRNAAQARETRYLGNCQLVEVVDSLRVDTKLKVGLQGPDMTLPMAREGLGIVISHLLGNAANHGASSVVIESLEGSDGPGFTILDDGPGISEGNAGRVFEPFFTTRRDDGGTGMGLAIVRNILNAHRGDISLLASRNGAKFLIRF